MKIGLGTYSLAWSIGVPGHLPENPMDVVGFLEFAHRHGFRLVQIADNLPLTKYSDLELESIKSSADQLGIAIEVGTRGLTIENVRKHLQIASVLGSSLLRIVIDQKGYEPSLPEINNTVKQLLPDLEQVNIRLAIENHDRLKAREFAEIITAANSRFVGICLDSVNSIGADEGFETVFETLGPLTINLHLKDYRIKRISHMMGFEITGTPAGQGMMPVEYVINALRVHGHCQTVILELWPAPEDNIELTILKEQDWVRQSAEYLFSNFNK